MPGITLNHEAEWARSIYWMTSILVDPACGIDRDGMRAALAADGIDTRPTFPPISDLPDLGTSAAPCRRPWRERIAERGINLPSGVRLRRDQVARVGEAVRRAVARSAVRRDPPARIGSDRAHPRSNRMGRVGHDARPAREAPSAGPRRRRAPADSRRASTAAPPGHASRAADERGWSVLPMPRPHKRRHHIQGLQGARCLPRRCLTAAPSVNEQYVVRRQGCCRGGGKFQVAIVDPGGGGSRAVTSGENPGVGRGLASHPSRKARASHVDTVTAHKNKILDGLGTTEPSWVVCRYLPVIPSESCISCCHQKK